MYKLSIRIFWIFIFLLISKEGKSQTEYSFQLTQDFISIEDSSIELSELTNDLGQGGSFSNYTIPSSTCSDNTETIGGFSFDKNAGLMFENDGFINCEYSISFTFQIDELLVRDDREGTPGTDWVHLLSFEHIDDHGIYIRVTSGNEGSGTLDFWPNGTVGTTNFFNTTDLYQLTLVRNCSGIVRIFINGTLFDTYDDSISPEYLPGTVNDSIVFFQDRPTTVLNDEASSGFVRNIVIANTEWTDDEIQEQTDNFCNTLIDLSFETFNNCIGDETAFSLSPNVYDADSIVWNFGDPDSGDDNTSNQQSSRHTFSSTGDYTVTVDVYYEGQSVSTSNLVTIQDFPVVDLGNDTTLVENEFLVLDVTSLGVDFLWQDGSVNSTYTVTEAGAYSVQVTNSAGCSGSDTINVNYTEFEIIIPNIFTPNGDGQNDTWIIEGIENFPNNIIYIYDRLGNLLITLPQYSNNWDGGALPVGTYFYRVERGNRREDVGSVSIIR